MKKNTGLNSIFKLNDQGVLLEYGKQLELYKSMNISIYLKIVTLYGKFKVTLISASQYT